jgi:hypothetical protein
MSKDVVEGLNYLACCNFVVGDLAARHILVGQDNTCKIGGLGLERDVSDAVSQRCRECLFAALFPTHPRPLLAVSFLVAPAMQSNRASNIRVRWTAPEVLPDAETVATVSWRRSGDSGVDISPQLLAALGASSQAPSAFTTCVPRTALPSSPPSPSPASHAHVRL